MSAQQLSQPQAHNLEVFNAKSGQIVGILQD